jgi:glycosyltransferase involved in cell wall biosynthesis
MMRVLAVANLFRADHIERVRPYRPMNAAASSWNTALFHELARTEIDLHVVQFWPIRRAVEIVEGHVTYHYLPRLPQVDTYTSIFKRLRVGALARRIRPDVIHGIGSEHGYAWAAVGHGVPSAVTIHGYLKVINGLSGHASLLKKLFLAREEQQALAGADRVMAINEYMRERFVEDGCARERTVIVPNALNPVYLEPFDEPAERDIDILMVGTLHRLKNQHVALELFTRLREEHGMTPKVSIVGGATADSADYEAELRAARETARLDNVTFCGKKAPRELADMYRRSRYLLHISEFEADPTVVAEALACGTLPLVNPVAGLAFRVKDGRNGHHVPIADRAAATALVAKHLQDERGRRALAAAGRGAVLDERRASNVARATADVYRDLAGRANGQLALKKS